ncbi:hypothetical protein [Acidisoma cladoniae]|uniref:hypothetical protein n=1 Tax=Acidisoma cladoniae TaxID=3040935 RepID=UPI00254ED2DE|nr:hypothetical protein [Acidisoma sp. PAMC 29798]
MADTLPPPNAGFVGQLMLELPPDSWLPPGYVLAPPARAGGDLPTAIRVRDPSGRQRLAYPDPSFRAPPPRRDSILDTIREQLGPIPTSGFWSPAQRDWLGMNRPDLVGDADRLVYGAVDGAAWLFDLASYGISASIVGGTQGLRHAGVLDETEAGQLQRDLNLMALVAGAEEGLNPARMATTEAAGSRVLARAEAAQGRLAVLARAGMAAGTVRLKQVAESGYPFGRLFGALEQIWAEPATLVPPAVLRAPRPDFRARWAAGNAFDKDQIGIYDFDQIYVVSPTSASGRVRLDSYLEIATELRAAGPVSRKLTQIADVTPATVIRYLNEAHEKYRPGRIFADVPSTPLELRNTPIKGRLFLEIPVQRLPVPQEIINKAKSLNITFRDINGKEY